MKKYTFLLFFVLSFSVYAQTQPTTNSTFPNSSGNIPNNNSTITNIPINNYPSTVSQPKKRYNIRKGVKISNIDEGIVVPGEVSNSGKRYAIVVGVNEYQDIGLSKLAKARNDAKAIGKMLTDIQAVVF